jgi:putative Holliday junction resolvase
MPPHNSKPHVVIAFDVGLKRTGIAIGHTLTRSAQPAATLEVKNGQLPWPAIDKLIDEWQPGHSVVGDPKTANPHLNKLIRRLMHFLQHEHKLTISRVDETLTTDAANHRLEGGGMTAAQKTQIRDQVAACIILDSYFNTQSEAD